MRKLITILIALFLFTGLYSQEEVSKSAVDSQKVLQQKLDTFYKSLDSLNLNSYDEYVTLEEALKHPDSVYKLVLKRKGYKDFPMEILKFKNLLVLNLRNNRISEIPPEIAELKELRVLNLSKNKLTELSSSVCKLKKLIALNASENQIETVSRDIQLLQNLQFWDMWGNSLNSLPIEVRNLKRLRFLDLRVISIDDDHQKNIESLLPQARVEFSFNCNCH
ncbi:MAG: leucine-rich repeat domain-containing protein [Bacteroidales bacterium]|nr:leucine-rich repeat domain-containing protein [Bacteroidales bacterium]